MFCVGFEVVGVLLIVCFLVANVLIMEKVVVKEDLHGPISIKLLVLMDVVKEYKNSRYEKQKSHGIIIHHSVPHSFYLLLASVSLL